MAFIALGAGEAHAMSAIQFMERFLADPATAFDNPPPRESARPTNTPLLSVPLPHLRPPAADAIPTLGYQQDDATDDLVAVPTDAMPMPRLRPTDLLPAQTEPELPKEEPKVAALPSAPLPHLVRPPPAVDTACGVAIAQAGVISTPLVPIQEGDCGIDTPVAVSALDGGAIKVSPKAIIDCHLAERLAGWVDDTVKPKVRAMYGEELTGLRVAASYACRNRDSLPDTKLSEHAHGNAIDIGAFKVGERWIEVEKGWNGGGDDADFLVATRKSACGPFTTVLGPGSDEFHTNHFHLDMIERRTAGPSKGLYCH